MAEENNVSTCTLWLRIISLLFRDNDQFYRKLYNGGSFSTIWQNKTHFYTILTTNLYDKSQTKVPYGLVWYYLHRQYSKTVVICLIILTTFPFDAGSSIKQYPDVWRTLSTLDPESKGNVRMIRQMTTAFWILSM